MKVGIFYKRETIKDESIVALLSDEFKKRGVEAVTISDYEKIEGFDVLLVLGGDGAILHCAIIASQKNIKILGVNYGTLGFLTEYEREETLKSVELVCSNGSKILKRSILQLEVRGNTYYALNEFSIQRNNLSNAHKQLVEFNADIGGGAIESIQADGVIVCTPTGSTAYSLSAGGSIMTPNLKAFMLTPICAFSLRSRPIVYSDDEVLSVEISGKYDSGFIFADGKYVGELKNGERVMIRKADFTADFLTVDGKNFFNKLTKINN